MSSVEGRRAAAPVERPRRAPTPSSDRCGLPATTRPAAALNKRDVAIGVAGAAEHGAQGFGVVRGIAALERLGVGALQPDVLGRDGEGADLAVRRVRRSGSAPWW